MKMKVELGDEVIVWVDGNPYNGVVIDIIKKDEGNLYKVVSRSCGMVYIFNTTIDNIQKIERGNNQ